jgi:hypothetical protein
MSSILHLLKSDLNPIALAAIDRQSRTPDTTLTVVLLHGTPSPRLPAGITVHRLIEDGSHGSLSYSDLLDLIFSADQVMTW